MLVLSSMRRPALALLVACALLLCAGSRHVGYAQDTSAFVSPEDAAAQLGPYLIGNADLPSGYTLNTYVQFLDTPVTLANDDASASSPLAELGTLQDEGLLLRVIRGAIPTPPGRGVITTFGTYVFDSAAHAQAFATGDSLPLPAQQ